MSQVMTDNEFSNHLNHKNLKNKKNKHPKWLNQKFNSKIVWMQIFMVFPILAIKMYSMFSNLDAEWADLLH